MNNSVYDRSIINVRRHKDTKLVTNYKKDVT